MFNKNNNYKKQNGRGFKTVKRVNNVFKARLDWGDNPNMSDDLYDEIAEVIEGTKFNKISIPVSASRSTLATFTDGELSEKDAVKVTAIGYIRSFDTDALVFDIVVFNNFLESVTTANITEGAELCIVPVFTTTKDGGLKTITKFMLEYHEVEENTEEAIEEIVEEAVEEEVSHDDCSPEEE